MQRPRVLWKRAPAISSKKDEGAWKGAKENKNKLRPVLNRMVCPGPENELHEYENESRKTNWDTPEQCGYLTECSQQGLLIHRSVTHETNVESAIPQKLLT